MKLPSLKTIPSCDMEPTRTRIKLQLEAIGTNLTELGAVDVEKHAKALTILFKLTQMIDMQAELDAAKQAADGLADIQDTYTPYDQIPPPSDDEMRAVRDRLNRLYARLCAPDDPTICASRAKSDGVNGA